MVRVLYIVNKVEQFGDTIVTLLASITILGASDVFAIVASCLAIVYWVPKIKREISTRYHNSVREYIKKFFHKKAKYDE